MKKIWKQRYQIIEEIGEGGNGRVYKVWDLHLEKEWAMKLLEEKYMVSEEKYSRKENLNELQVLKKISHPNFPRIVDAFEEDQRKILIMDLIHGITLEKIIKKGSLEEKKILLIAEQIVEAILYLHQQTPVLLYMDLKPSNIIVEENGKVKLVDLGSVIIKGSKGNVSGSFGFASPEQIRVQKEGRFLNEKSDVFSLGMVLYAMAVGNCQRIPVIESNRRYGIYVRKDNPMISEVLGRIIEKCTRGNQERRYASMREVKCELENGLRLLEKKKGFFCGSFKGRRKRREEWYQEKSIFCTEGRHSFYIAKKVFVLVVGIMCLLPGQMILADGKERQKKQELSVVVRDTRFRKVLVKEGCAYETGSNLLLEIPWEDIIGDRYQIIVECKDMSEEKKRFYIECIYAK